PKSPPVAVISDLMARHIWKGEDALGKCFIAGDDGRCREIVGIIRDVHRQEIEEAPFMLYFTMVDQQVEPAVPNHLLVTTAGDPEQMMEPVRRELQALRGDLPYIQ